MFFFVILAIKKLEFGLIKAIKKLNNILSFSVRIILKSNLASLSLLFNEKFIFQVLMSYFIIKFLFSGKIFTRNHWYNLI